MVRASSRQQKSSEEVSAVAESQTNGHSNGITETMETESVAVSKTLKTSKSTKNKSKPEEPKKLANSSPVKGRGNKRKISPINSPVSSERSSGSNQGSKRKAVETTQQPQTKKAKVDNAIKTLEVKLSAPEVTGGVVLTVGMGDIGQLGMGPDVEEKTRVAVVPGLPDNIVSICAGGLHSVCLDSQGKVHTWGCNDEGGLGRTTSCEEENFSAGPVEGISGRVVQITAGDCHTAALTEDGTVYAWGSFRDNNGPLGFLERGTMQRSPRIVPVAGGEPVVKIASGNNHLALLTSSGRLLTCGCGESGQLGRLAEMFATRDSRNRNGFDVLLVPAVVKVYRTRRLVLFDGVWAGGDNTFARDASTGHVYACGLNNYNQMGDPDTNTKFQPILLKAIMDRKWKQFTCGQHHGLALESTGRVFSMGRHDYGRLGLGENHKKDAVTPTLVTVLEKELVAAVSAAGSVSLVVAESGNAFGFGMGTSNQLSQGNEEDCWEPTALTGKQLAERRVLAASVGGQHSVVLAAARD